jgi:hypothetical protein
MGAGAWADAGFRETILAAREAFRKQRRPSVRLGQTTGCAHGNLPKRDLPRSPQGRIIRDGNDAGSAAVIDFVVALLAFLSIGVFLAHALDAYRTS